MEKDKKLLQSVFDRFGRKIAYRCKIDKETIEKIDLTEVLTAADQRMLDAIRHNNDGLCESTK